VKIQVVVFWIMTPCIVMVGYRRFGGMKMLTAWSSEMLLSNHITTWHHNSEDLTQINLILISLKR